MVKRGLNGLGAVDLSQYNIAQSYLATANANLQALQQAYAANPTSFDATFAPSLNEAQNRYTTILQAYIYAYGLAVGNPPSTTGLEGMGRMRGLGQWQTYVVAGVGIAVIVAALIELNNFIAVLQTKANAALATAQAQGQQQNNIAYAQTQLTAAIASGDTTAQASWQAAIDDASTPIVAGSSDATDWLSQNWMWVVGGVAAFFVLKDVL